jgi:drug/metabolite transporter (DMT)-like permease
VLIDKVTRRGLLLFVAMCVIWGIPYALIRVAVGELSPATLVFVRTGVAALILMPIVLARGGLQGITRWWLPVLAFAAVEIGIPWFLVSSAEQRITSSLAGLLISGVPLVGVVIAPMFGNRDGIGRTGVIGLLIGLAGVGAIVGFDLRASDPLSLVEIALVAVAYAIGPAILSRFLQGVPSMTVTGLALTVCALAYAPFGVAQWPHSMPSAGVIESVAVLAVLCTALAFLLFFALIAEVGPVRATVITYFNPAVAALLGVVALHENFTIGMGAGFVLVLIGSTLATRKRASAKSPAGLSERQADPA